MLTNEMIAVLSCPVCHAGGLSMETTRTQGDRIEEGTLTCSNCGTMYDVHGGIPNLVPPSINNNHEWKMWKEHLNGFDARRQDRKKEKMKLPHPSGKQMHLAFFKFTQIDEGNVLDIGCGPGKLRSYLDESRVTYYGLDPMPMEEAGDFPFVHALAEHIPFKDATFSHIVVVSALDHFKNLDRFFQEAKRVLRPDGSLHILQSVHEVRGPVSLVKMLVHWAKDLIDAKATHRNNSQVPKHMNEFTTSSLLNVTGKHFSLYQKHAYSKKWYSPTKLFISLHPSEKLQSAYAGGGSTSGGEKLHIA